MIAAGSPTLSEDGHDSSASGFPGTVPIAEAERAGPADSGSAQRQNRQWQSMLRANTAEPRSGIFTGYQADEVE
jgi:hypothetical protein